MMRRVLMDDDDAAKHHLIKWQEALNIEQYARKHFSGRVAATCALKAEQERCTAEAIIAARFGIQRFQMHDIAPHAHAAFVGSLKLGHYLVNRAADCADREQLTEEEYAKRTIGPELWAASQRLRQ